jgi:hypothetical protein
MKSIKLAAALSLALASLVGFSTSSYASNVTPTQPNPVAAVNQNISTFNLFNAQAVAGFSYSFSDLGKGSGALSTKVTITFTEKSDVYLTLVQWEKSGNTTSSASMSYDLVNTSSLKSAGEKFVTGLYTDKNTTIGWTSVLPGTYKIILRNYGSGLAGGNGFVNAYAQ